MFGQDASLPDEEPTPQAGGGGGSDRGKHSSRLGLKSASSGVRGHGDGAVPGYFTGKT